MYFSKFPKDHISVKKFAKAGFYYEGDDDTVRFLSCRVMLYDRQLDTDPTTQHLYVVERGQ